MYAEAGQELTCTGNVCLGDLEAGAGSCGERGFTIVELLVASVVFTILLVITATVAFVFLGQVNFATATYGSQNQAQILADYLQSYLQGAAPCPGASAALISAPSVIQTVPPVSLNPLVFSAVLPSSSVNSTATTTGGSFVAPVEVFTVAADRQGRVSISVSPCTGGSGPSLTLLTASEVRSINFVYYLGVGATSFPPSTATSITPSQLASVSAIGITVTTFHTGGRPVTFSTTVYFLNLACAQNTSGSSSSTSSSIGSSSSTTGVQCL
jgi:prepilin-type N-terminal cleavage/methylation domain-containing protein